MMKRISLLFIVFFVSWPVWGESALLSRFSKTIEKNALIIEETLIEPCGICRKKKLKRALDAFDRLFAPEKQFTISGSLLEKVSGSDQLLTLNLKGSEILKLSFMFHTERKHLIGIRSSDYTEKSLSDLFIGSPSGQRFSADIRVIPFEYGDRRSIRFSSSSASIEIHCKLLGLKRSPQTD